MTIGWRTDTTSLFPEEWQAHFGDELDQAMRDWSGSNLTAEQIDQRAHAFCAAHPPRFEGVYCSPSVFAGGELAELPPLIERSGLQIDAWHGQPPRQIRALIPIPHHRLLALVTDSEVIIIREDELRPMAPSAALRLAELTQERTQ
jgi:hypothetical protein